METEIQWPTPENLRRSSARLKTAECDRSEVVANAVAGLAEISQTCGKDLLDLDKARKTLKAWVIFCEVRVFSQPAAATRNDQSCGQGNIHKLLAALNECNEWGQVAALKLHTA